MKKSSVRKIKGNRGEKGKRGRGEKEEKLLSASDNSTSPHPFPLLSSSPFPPFTSSPFPFHLFPISPQSFYASFACLSSRWRMRKPRRRSSLRRRATRSTARRASIG